MDHFQNSSNGQLRGRTLSKGEEKKKTAVELDENAIKGITEIVSHQISGALDSCIGQLAYLFAVEAVPPPAVELLIELKYEFGVYEVCKGVAHIARVGVIDRQVQEVYMHSMVFAYLFQQHVLRILVWNMPDHKRCTKVALDLRHRSFTFSGIMRYSLAY